jgi:hypothetical protein
MIHDPDVQVSRSAKRVVDDELQSMPTHHVMEETPANFVDTTDYISMALVETELGSRINTLSKELGVSLESAGFLLHDYGFPSRKLELRSSLIQNQSLTNPACSQNIAWWGMKRIYYSSS